MTLEPFGSSGTNYSSPSYQANEKWHGQPSQRRLNPEGQDSKAWHDGESKEGLLLYCNGILYCTGSHRRNQNVGTGMAHDPVTPCDLKAHLLSKCSLTCGQHAVQDEMDKDPVVESRAMTCLSQASSIPSEAAALKTHSPWRMPPANEHANKKQASKQKGAAERERDTHMRTHTVHTYMRKHMRAQHILYTHRTSMCKHACTYNTHTNKLTS